MLIVTFLPNALAVTALPYLANGREAMAKRQRRTTQVLGVSLLASVPIASVFAVGGYLLLPLLGSGYEDYRGTVALMALTGVAVSVNNLLGSIAVAGERFRLWITSDIVLAAFIAGLSIPLVSAWGADGMACAYLLAYTISAAMLTPAARLTGKSLTAGARH
jgi:O-antigen/teichoic acid export membrane protein